MAPATAAPPASAAEAPGAPPMQRKGVMGRRQLSVLGAGDFDGPEELVSLLADHGIDAPAWREQKGVKSVDQLYNELELGEARLEFFSGGKRPRARATPLARENAPSL